MIHVDTLNICTLYNHLIRSIFSDQFVPQIYSDCFAEQLQQLQKHYILNHWNLLPVTICNKTYFTWRKKIYNYVLAVKCKTHVVSHKIGCGCKFINQWNEIGRQSEDNYKDLTYNSRLQNMALAQYYDL
jgi:hypothetical protein